MVIVLACVLTVRVDNGECLDLIERKLGVLSLIDEESRFPKGRRFR